MEIDFLQYDQYDVTTFATGETCIGSLAQNPHLIILDYTLDGINPTAMNGLQTLDKIKYFKPEIPIVMLSSQDKIEVAVDCMHHHAYDYVVKSETAFFHLQNIIGTIIIHRKMEKELNWYVDLM